jgi:chromosome segregation ATPase
LQVAKKEESDWQIPKSEKDEDDEAIPGLTLASSRREVFKKEAKDSSTGSVFCSSRSQTHSLSQSRAIQLKYDEAEAHVATLKEVNLQTMARNDQLDRKVRELQTLIDEAETSSEGFHKEKLRLQQQIEQLQLERNSLHQDILAAQSKMKVKSLFHYIPHPSADFRLSVHRNRICYMAKTLPRGRNKTSRS